MVREEWRLSGDEWVADSGLTVAAVDGSGKDDGALRWAAADAARHGGDLLVVTVVDDSLLVPPQASLASWKPYAEEVLARAAGMVGETLPPGRLHRLVLAGDPAAEITERFPEVRAVVVGRRGLGALERVLVGSTSAGVVARSLAPVVVVPDDWTPSRAGRAPIVAGVDPDRPQDRMLGLAFERAVRLGVPLVAVHTLGRGRPLARREADETATGADGHAAFDDLMDKWAGVEPEVELRRVRAEGAPATAVLAAAADAQLAILGRGPRALLPGVLLGTTLRALLHYADCPVLAVPEPLEGGDSR